MSFKKVVNEPVVRSPTFTTLDLANYVVSSSKSSNDVKYPFIVSLSSLHQALLCDGKIFGYDNLMIQLKKIGCVLCGSRVMYSRVRTVNDHVIIPDDPLLCLQMFLIELFMVVHKTISGATVGSISKMLKKSGDTTVRYLYAVSVQDTKWISDFHFKYPVSQNWLMGLSVFERIPFFVPKEWLILRPSDMLGYSLDSVVMWHYHEFMRMQNLNSYKCLSQYLSDMVDITHAYSRLDWIEALEPTSKIFNIFNKCLISVDGVSVYDAIPVKRDRYMFLLPMLLLDYSTYHNYFKSLVKNGSLVIESDFMIGDYHQIIGMISIRPKMSQYLYVYDGIKFVPVDNG